MNPLAVTAAGLVNLFAALILVKFLTLWAVPFMPAGPIRDGFMAVAPL